MTVTGIGVPPFTTMASWTGNAPPRPQPPTDDVAIAPETKVISSPAVPVEIDVAAGTTKSTVVGTCAVAESDATNRTVATQPRTKAKAGLRTRTFVSTALHRGLSAGIARDPVGCQPWQ